MKGLVLLSGGIDSTVCLAIARAECGSRKVEALSLKYDSKHSVRELASARTIAALLGVPWREVLLPQIFRGSGSTLTTDSPNPQVSYESLRGAEGPSPAYVPFRNANFLSIAATVAMVQKCDYVYFGAHADDSHNWAYPDCTPEFIGAMANAIYVGTYMRVRLRTPLMWLTKSKVVGVGEGLGAPLHLTYSCYEGGEDHCGLCSTCINRREAFTLSAVQDPTKYEAMPTSTYKAVDVSPS